MAFNKLGLASNTPFRLSVRKVLLSSTSPVGLGDKELLVGCVNGAILKQDYLDQLKKAGFVNITIHKETPAFLPDYGLNMTFSAFKQ